MNNEVTRKWALAPKAGDDAIGAALRRAVPCGGEAVPDEIGDLVNALERRTRRGAAQAAMS